MIPDVVINYWAVLVAAIVNMVIGSLWYGPIFGKIWIKLQGFKQSDMKKAQKAGMGKYYFTAFIGAIVMACVLAHFVKYVGGATVVDGLQLGFWIWLGFIVPVMLGSVLWEGKSIKLFLLNIGYYLVMLLINGVILALWQ